MNMMIALAVIQLATMYGVDTRIGTRESQQISKWHKIISPVPNYIETGDLGPYPIHAIEWIEINLIKTTYIGRLVPPKVTDYSEVIQTYLEEIPFTFNPLEKTVRIYLIEK